MKFEVTKIESAGGMYGELNFIAKVHLKYEDGTKNWFIWYPRDGPLTKKMIVEGARMAYNYQEGVGEGGKEMKFKVTGIEKAEEVEGAEKVKQAQQSVGKEFEW